MLATAAVLAVGSTTRASEASEDRWDALESNVPGLFVIGEAASLNRSRSRALLWLEAPSLGDTLPWAVEEAGFSQRLNSENFTREHFGRARLWVRGHSSALHPKKSYRLELTDEAGQSVKAPLLGMPKESDWILYASYTDKTFLRDVLAHEVWREMGHYAVRWRFVDLYLLKPDQEPAPTKERPAGTAAAATIFPFRFTNHLSLSPTELRAAALNAAAAPYQGEGPALPEYQGLYILMEKIKRGKHRVNIARLRQEDAAEAEVSGGYIFKKDRVNPGEHGFKTSQGMDFAFEEPKERDITPAQAQWLTNYVNEFERVLFSDNFADPVSGYAKYIDVDSFIDYHWIVEATRNVDGYWFSQFYHKDRGGKLAMGPVWDWDISFGNCFYQEGYKTNGWRWDQIRGNHYKWFGRLFEDPDFVQKYIDRWAVLRTNIFATSNLLAKIDDWSSQLDEAQQRNYERWPTLGRAVHPNKFVGATYQDEIRWLKEWITGRLAWIGSQGFPPPIITLTEKPNAQGSVGAKSAAPPTRGDPADTQTPRHAWVNLAAQVGRIYYTLDRTDPRQPGGKVSTNATEYITPVEIRRGQQVTARVRSEYGLWSPPVVLPPQ